MKELKDELFFELIDQNNSSEVFSKLGTNIAPKGKKITYKVIDPKDLERVIFKGSDSRISIRELGFSEKHGYDALLSDVKGILNHVIDKI
jgi:C4-type Zn-finger protein